MLNFQTGAPFALCLTVCLVSCGEVTDPDVVTRNDLKAPSALEIVDKGNGSVQLKWTTANFEDDFEGYNIYGAIIGDEDLESLGVVVGKPIQLLDSEGEPIEAAKNILSSFNYQTGNEYALPGADDNAEAEYNTAELKFSALPYHKLRTANKEANLPTCKPLTDGVCQGLGTEKEDTEAENITSLGDVIYDFPETLEVGTQVCFFVFSVQDGGAEISQSSSDVACMTPKYAVDPESFSLNVSSQSAPELFKDYRDSCIAGSSDCDTLDMTSGLGTIGATTETRTVQFERYSAAGGGVYLASGKYAVIKSLGYFADGFDDPSYFAQTPVLSEFNESNAQLPEGYSLPGQSITLNENYIYVIASANTEDTPTSADFYYDWLFVESISCSISGDSDTCTLDYKMLFSKNPNSLD